MVITRDRKKVIFEGKKSCCLVIKNCKISDGNGEKKVVFQLIFCRVYMPFGQTATATGTGRAKCASVAVNGFGKVPWRDCNCNRNKFCLRLCCSCSCGSAFLKPLTATERNLVAPVPVAVATRQFLGKITKPFLKIRKKALRENEANAKEVYILYIVKFPTPPVH